MAAGGDVRAGGAFVELYTKDSKFRKGLDGAAARFKTVGKSMMAIGAGIAGVGIAAGVSMIHMAHKAAEGGAALAEMAERTGMSVESLSTFKVMAKMAGLELEDLEVAIKKMQKAAFGDEASKMFAKIGVSMEAFRKMDPTEQLLTIAGAMEKFGNEGQRNAIILEIFGRSGLKMVNVLGEGREETEKLMKEIKELGLVTSTEGAQGAKEMHRSMVLLDLVNAKIAGTIGSALLPAMKSLVKMDITSHGNILKTVQANKKLVVVFAMAAAGTIVLGGAIIALGAVITGLGTIIGVVVPLLNLLYKAALLGAVGMGKLALAMIANPFVILGLALAGVIAYMLGAGDAAKKVGQGIGQAFRGAKSDVVTAMTGIKNALASGDLAAATAIGLALVELEWAKFVANITKMWEETKAGFKIGFLDLQEAFVRWTIGPKKAAGGPEQKDMGQSDIAKAAFERVAVLEQRIKNLQARLDQAAGAAGQAGAIGGHGKGGPGALVDTGQMKMGAYGQIGGGELNQVFGARGAGGGGIIQKQAADIKEVKQAAKQIHVVNIKMLGVANATLEEIKSLRAMRKALFGP